VQIDINAPDLTFENLAEIYKHYRKLFNYTGKKSLTDKQLKLHLLVESQGGAPSRDKETFWRTITQLWNQDNPGEQYSTWQGVRKLYHGMKDKIRVKI